MILRTVVERLLSKNTVFTVRSMSAAVELVTIYRNKNRFCRDQEISPLSLSYAAAYNNVYFHQSIAEWHISFGTANSAAYLLDSDFDAEYRIITGQM